LVSLRLLLLLHVSIPILLLLIQAVDVYCLNGKILSNLPVNPEHFILYQLLFGTPHIMASSLLVITNSDYIRFYKPKLIAMSLLIIVIFGIGSLFISYKILYILFIVWTILHVFKQQIGVGCSLNQLPKGFFYLLLYLCAGIVTLIYLGILFQNILTRDQTTMIKFIASSIAVMLIITSSYCHFRIDIPLGKKFLWVNTLLVLTTLHLYLQKYHFLAILTLRIVHDITAYIFYITHEYNKHQEGPQNGLYRCAQFFKLPVFVILPTLSIALTYIFQIYTNQLINTPYENLLAVKVIRAISIGLIGYLSLMHYFTESFIWKKNSPLRKYVFIKP
jgi:hypothetical protein